MTPNAPELEEGQKTSVAAASAHQTTKYRMSPDFNPLEEVFAKVKAYLRACDVVYRSTSIPRLIFASATATVTEQDCIGFAKHAGYVVA